MTGERRVMQEALFYGFSLERRVPDNHLLRKIALSMVQADQPKSAFEVGEALFGRSIQAETPPVLFVIFHIPSILIRLWKSDGIEVRSQTICTEATSPTCVTETIRPTTLPLGSVGYENKTDEQGQRLICWTGRWSTACAHCGARERATAT